MDFYNKKLYQSAELVKKNEWSFDYAVRHLMDCFQEISENQIQLDLAIQLDFLCEYTRIEGGRDE